MNYEEFRKEVEKISMGIYPHEIYFPLKEYGIKHITNPTVSRLKICIILWRLNIPIVISLVQDLEGANNPNSVSSTLAKLGDKRVLYLLGYEDRKYGSRLVYTINSDFAELLNMNFDKIDSLRKRLDEEGLEFV